MSELVLTPRARSERGSGADRSGIHVGIVLKFDNWDEVESFATRIREYQPVFLLGDSARTMRQCLSDRTNRQEQLLSRMQYGKQYTTGQLHRLSGTSIKTLQRDIAELAIRGEVTLTKKLGGKGGRTTIVERVLSPSATPEPTISEPTLSCRRGRHPRDCTCPKHAHHIKDEQPNVGDMNVNSPGTY